MLFLTIQKKEVYSQIQETIEKKNREGNIKFCYHSKESKYNSLLISNLKTMKSKVGT